MPNQTRPSLVVAHAVRSRADAEAISIEATSLPYLPFYVAMLRRKDRERAVVLDAYQGWMSEPIGRVLTANIGYLAESIAAARPPHRPAPAFH